MVLELSRSRPALKQKAWCFECLQVLNVYQSLKTAWDHTLPAGTKTVVSMAGDRWYIAYLTPANKSLYWHILKMIQMGFYLYSSAREISGLKSLHGRSRYLDSEASGYNQNSWKAT